MNLTLKGFVKKKNQIKKKKIKGLHLNIASQKYSFYIFQA